MLDIPDARGNHSTEVHKEMPEGTGCARGRWQTYTKALRLQQLTCGVSLGCHLTAEVWRAFVPSHGVFVVTLITICITDDGGSRALAQDTITEYSKLGGIHKDHPSP